MQRRSAVGDAAQDSATRRHQEGRGPRPGGSPPLRRSGSVSLRSQHPPARPSGRSTRGSALVGILVKSLRRTLVAGRDQHGAVGGRAGIAEFTELRWITVQTQPRHYPFRRVQSDKSSLARGLTAARGGHLAGVPCAFRSDGDSPLTQDACCTAGRPTLMPERISRRSPWRARHSGGGCRGWASRRPTGKSAAGCCRSSIDWVQVLIGAEWIADAWSPRSLSSAPQSREFEDSHSRADLPGDTAMPPRASDLTESLSDPPTSRDV
jgi:hypothetical protein